MTVDAYLAELERLLPRAARLRALPEIREHLRDSAARHRASGVSQLEAEEAATRECGPTSEVARCIGSELARRETRVASLLAVGAVVAFVFPLYVVPENTLPPATWAETPSEIVALQRAAIGLWLLAGVLAAASAVLAWTRWPRATALALVGTTGAIAGSLAVTIALTVRWISIAPSTPNLALAVPLALACLGACICTALWARASRGRLVVPD